MQERNENQMCPFLLLRLQFGLLYFPSARYFFIQNKKGAFYFSGLTDKKSLTNEQKSARTDKIPPKPEVGGAPRGKAPDIDSRVGSRVGGNANFAAS